MADLKISQLTGATTPLAGTEVLPIVQSGTTKKVATDDLTVKNVRSNATTGLLQIAGPGAGTTRTMTVPNANFTAARTDAAQTFTGDQTFNNNVSAASISIGAANPTSGYLFDARGRGRNVSTSNYLWDFVSPDTNAPQVQVYADNSVAGLVIGGSLVPNFSVFVSGEKFTIETTTGAVRAGADNAQSLGTATIRWSTVYAVTPTINTSDAREKQQVADLTAKERAVAKRIKGLIKTFKFNDAVETKGDGARIHVGVLAQDVAAAFEAEGLDPSKYALFCHDSWDDKFEDIYEDREIEREDGINEIVSVNTGRQRQVLKAGDRYGIRYEELLAFIITSI